MMLPTLLHSIHQPRVPDVATYRACPHARRILAAAIALVLLSPFSILNSAAASLESSDIGEFFTLPAWMPTEVASHDTPGSDPADGSGWYLQTAVVTTRFERITQHFKVDRFIYQKYHWRDGSPDTIEYADWTDRTSDFPSQHWVSDTTFYFGGPGFHSADIDKDAESHSWTEYATGSYPDCWLEETITYSATADNVQTNIETSTLSVPRAARLTPFVHAGVLSALAGYCERQYYCAEGKSNVWDVSFWGPRYDKKTFVFDPCPTNNWEYMRPTNRTVTSRRLSGSRYNDLDKLGKYIGGFWADTGFLHVGWTRPNWIHSWPVETNRNPQRPRTWWSSTETRMMHGGGKIIPAFTGWLDSYYTTQSEDYISWADCSQVLACFGSDTALPLVELMHGLDFGQSYYTWENCHPAMLDSNIGPLVKTNYSSSDYHTITNMTRRLDSRSISSINQMLGLMDRTYHEPEIHYPNVATNETHVFESYYSGFVTCRVDNVTLDGHIEIDLRNASWRSGTNRWSHQIEEGPSSGAIRIRTSKPCAYFTAEVSGSKYIPIPISAIQEAIDAQFGPVDPSQGSLIIAFNGSDILYNGHINIGFYVPELSQYPGVISFPCTNVEIGVYAKYRLAYSTCETAGKDIVGFTQPGLSGVNKVKSQGVGCVYGLSAYHSDSIPEGMTTDVHPTDYVRYNGSEISMDQMMNANANLVNGLIDKCKEKYRSIMVEQIGVDPLNFEAMLVPDLQEVSRLRDSCGGTVTITAGVNDPYKWNMIIAIDENGRLDENDYHVYYNYIETNAMVSASIDAFGFLTNLPPTSPSVPATSMDAKFGVMVRTDWNWKTLKRTDD